MRILHLTWEYPPLVYGGLGRHVHALAHAQAADGHDVIVITQAYGHDADDVDIAEPPCALPGGGLRVLRTGGAPARQEPAELLDHVGRMQARFVSAGELLLRRWQPDVVHAHDWMVGEAAGALRAAGTDVDSTLVATIHATEAGRNHGWITTELSTSIHAHEWHLANTADALIACSQHMAEEVRTLFGVHPTRVVPNGIDPDDWKARPDAAAQVRADYADATALLVYTGRVEWEKGVQTILEALPQVLREHPGVRVVVAGRGSYLPTLQGQAVGMGLGDATRFLGWVSEEHLRAIVAAADVAIVPSFYEPFGLVALEAAALGAPVIVARTGGLAEFAGDGEHAATFRPADPDSLAAAVNADLSAPDAAARRARRASAAVAQRYAWRDVARSTVEVDRLAAIDASAPADDPRRRNARLRHALAVPQLIAPLGQLMDVGW